MLIIIFMKNKYIINNINFIYLNMLDVLINAFSPVCLLKLYQAYSLIIL
jgi:hypothetical protein